MYDLLIIYDVNSVVEYAHDYVEFFNDQNFPFYPNHPQMDGLVYVDKHTQPSTGDPCFTELLSKYYGQYTPQNVIANITSVFQTGDTQAVIYDYSNQYIYVSNAAIYDPPTLTGAPAYDRPFTQFKMLNLFAEKPPVF